MTIMDPYSQRPLADLERLAQAAFSAGDDRAVIDICNAILRRAPKAAEIHFMLGLVAARHGRPDKALQALGYTLALQPRHAGAYAHLAAALLAEDRREEAQAAAERAATLAPEDPAVLDVTGVVMTSLGRHHQALALFERAAKLSGKPDHLCNQASTLEFFGRREDACIAYRKCLAQAPGHTRAWFGLSRVRNGPADGSDLKAMRLVAESADGARSQREIGHALAAHYEEMNEPEAVMHWLAFAKSLSRAMRDDPSPGQALLFEAARRSLADDYEPAHSGKPAPIFVVGAPRSGTTLLERILSGHSLIQSGGELPDFPRTLRRLTGLRSKSVVDSELIDASWRLEPALIGNSYADSVLRSRGLSGIFIDKLPLNMFLAPLILRALPNARVICLRRHPADCVLSGYKQLFEDEFADYDHFLDLEWAGHHLARFVSLSDHFRSVLPPERYCEIRYEDLVADVAGETKRALAFCGLSFEDACLRFFENQAPVSTPSAMQVRSPLYDRAIGRWRRYATALEPALDLLAKAGLMTSETNEGP